MCRTYGCISVTIRLVATLVLVSSLLMACFESLLSIARSVLWKAGAVMRHVTILRFMDNTLVRVLLLISLVTLVSAELVPCL